MYVNVLGLNFMTNKSTAPGTILIVFNALKQIKRGIKFHLKIYIKKIFKKIWNKKIR